MATQIKLRRDTAANWTSANPTLGSGEPGFETDTGKLKIGDGSSNWVTLGYATPGTAGVYSNTMAAAYLTIYSGNISAGNITVSGTINGTATSASTATYASTAGLATNATNVVGATQANITSVGTLTSVTSSGNITASTANVYAANIKGNTAIYGAAYYWANGVAFASSSYSNTTVGYYLNSNLISSTISLTGNVIANALYGNSYLYSNGVSILSGIGGTYSNSNVASYLTSYAGNLTAGNITVTGNVTHPSNSYILGDFTNSTVAYRTVFQTANLNSSTGIYALPSGTNTAASWQALNNSVSTNASKIFIATNGTTDVQIGSGINGSGTYLPLSIWNNGAAQITLYPNGNVYMSNANPITTTGNINAANVSLTNNISGNVAFFNSYQYANGVVWNGNLYTTGNVTATNSNVTQIGGTVNNSYSNTYNNATYTNSNVSSYLVTYGGNILAGNLNANGAVYANAYYWYNNGAPFSSGGSTYSNANVAGYLPTFTANLTAGNISITSNLTVGSGATGLILRNLVNSTTQGAIYSSYLTPTAINYVLRSGTGNNTYLNAPSGVGFVYVGAGDTQTVSISSGTAGTTYNVQSLLVTSGGMGVTGDSAFTANLGIAGNLSAGNISTTGTVSAATGTFTANVTAANLNTAGNAAATYFVGNGSLLTGIVAVSSYSNTNVQNYLPTYSGSLGNITANVTAGAGGVLTGYHNGAIGANVANTGAFTTVSATGTITAAYFAPTSGGQFLGYVTGAIGANVANSGAFTTVTATGSITGATSITAGGQMIGYHTGAIGANAANTGAFTTVTTTGGYINGALGANTPNSVVATSVTTSAGGQVTGYLTGAVGANTPNSGAFTTVTTTGSLTSQGTITGAGQVIGYFNGVIGANSANSGAFTTLSTTSNATIGGNLIPSANVTYDLGTATARWRTLYLSGSTIDLGGASISGSANGLQVGAINNSIIGNVTPAAGTFTTLTAQNGVLAAGGQITGYLTGAIGANTANSGTFTTATITNSTNTTGLGTGAFIVNNGGASIQKDLYVGGNLIVANIISQQSQTLVTNDPLLYLSANAGAYNYSIGFYSHFVGGNVPQYAHTGFVRNYTDNQWYLFSNIPEPTGGAVNVSATGVVYDSMVAGGLTLANTTSSTSTTSGALQVAGGAGIAGNVFAGAYYYANGASISGASTTFNGISVNAGTIGNSGAILYGTLNSSSASQTNITQVGNLNGLSVSAQLIPSSNNTVTLGNATAYWSTVYGVNFVGTSTTAKYADLAERYLADQYYAPGTVVIFGGDKEITTTDLSHDRTVAGVISTNPAYLMNDNDDLNMLPVALQGRVPCAVKGPVTKGQMLVTSGIAGVAQALNDDMWKPGCVIGKSLTDHLDSTVEVIEIAVGRD
jgi:Major tropism determinant N-terminal domain